MAQDTYFNLKTNLLSSKERLNNAKKVFRVFDHCSIFLLIAGSYTPICLLVLPRKIGVLLLSGGLIYTIGGVIYALKLPIFNNRHKYFGSHEIFHLFVMGGSACHFVVMFLL